MAYKSPHNYTPEQDKFIKEHVPGRGNAELVELVNSRFGLSLTVTQIKRYKQRRHLRSGLTGRFEPGHVPFNKGRKGLNQGGEKTQFRPGHKPHNYMPVGSERINGYGYTDIKIAEPNKWKGKHVIVWEEANGPVPAGHAVIFGDGNRRNIELENLILVSRKQLVRMNQHNLIQDDAELTRTGVLIADLQNRIGERKRSAKRGK